jgi:hypothetical protein
MGHTQKAQLVIDAMNMAITQRKRRQQATCSHRL